MLADHRMSGAHLMIDPTRNVPFAKATMCSPDRTVQPTHMPFSNLSSRSPVLRFVLGSLNITASPNGMSATYALRPLILSIDVRPQLCILHLVMMYAACRISHGMIGESIVTGSFIFSDNALLKVRINPLTSRIVLSILALLFESPTLASSNVVGASFRLLAISLRTSTIAGSVSVLSTMWLLGMPAVDKSSAILLGNQGSDMTPLPCTAYAHTLSHNDSHITIIVRLFCTLSLCSNSSTSSIISSCTNA